ncbi:hypothetical protein B0T22DRAFT_462433 [Podospora appendiculata]|uniref:Uncharacterized protein n=1 Tax=Podospora appendiculata TaxID=314037 RepID=A0AAE0XBX4_9PEZI|nr:hypothetical protein B0T22DRAFT_462433 [Podospora appendiculata]
MNKASSPTYLPYTSFRTLSTSAILLRLPPFLVAVGILASVNMLPGSKSPDNPLPTYGIQSKKHRYSYLSEPTVFLGRC